MNAAAPPKSISRRGQLGRAGGLIFMMAGAPSGFLLNVLYATRLGFPMLEPGSPLPLYSATLSRSALGARFRFLPPKSGFAAALAAVRCGSVLCLCSAIGSHSARAYAAALAVRRRVRCLLQSHVT